jgi:hypothetical protein
MGAYQRMKQQRANPQSFALASDCGVSAISRRG